MPRIANMPYIYPEKGSRNHKDKRRYEYRRRWPADVKAALGKTWCLYKFPQGVTEAQANELSAELNIAFQNTVNAVHDNRPVPVLDMRNHLTAVIDPRRRDDSRIRMMPANTPGLIEVGGGTFVLDDEPNTPAATVEFAAVVNAWADENNKLQRSRDDRMSKMTRLMGFLGHTDLARVTPDDLQKYKESLVALMKGGTWRGKTVDDHIEMVKTMFKWAKDNRKLATNPAIELSSIGAKTDPRDERKDFDAADIRLILTAARSADPVIRWSNWLSAMSGARLAEIIEANTVNIEITPEGAIFHVRLDNRPRTQRLKNDFAPRPFPIHSAVMREGFGEYVASLLPGPLFPTVKLDRDGRAANNASHIVNPWLRDIGITDPRKVFHSWRHTFKTLCRGRLEEEIHDAITGHSNGSIGRGYGEYPMPVLREAIERIPDPTASPKAAA